ncbi:MAG TPA: MFS transporter [Phototrophicaceae bacterium]|jgi:DHA3 family tetracycline resistance protein-like MFS transporter|nr:MFS transporter [Phototrophicaceae bacterium]
MRMPFSNSSKHDAYRVWLVFSALTSIGFTLSFTISLIYQAVNVGLNPLQLVLVGTVLEISCFLFEVPTGIVADLYSRRLSVIIGSLLIGIGFIIEGSLPVFGGILLSQVIWGIGATFHSGASDAWLADELGEDRMGQAYLRSAQLDKLVSFFAIIASVVIASINIQVAIILGGVVHVLNGLYLLRFMPENGFTAKPKEERATFKAMAATFKTGLSVIRVRPVLLTIVAITLIAGAYSESYDRLSTPHILENFTFPTINGAVLPPVIWFGILSMIGLLFGATFSEVIRRRVKMDNAGSIARALLYINSVMIVGVLVFALTGSLLLALAVNLLVRMLRGVIQPLQMTWINQGLEPQVRATVLSTISQTDAFGQIAGGPLFGWIGTQFGLRVALSLGALVLAPALALYGRGLRQTTAAPIPASQVVPAEKV